MCTVLYAGQPLHKVSDEDLLCAINNASAAYEAAKLYCRFDEIELYAQVALIVTAELISRHTVH